MFYYSFFYSGIEKSKQKLQVVHGNIYSATLGLSIKGLRPFSQYETVI